MPQGADVTAPATYTTKASKPVVLVAHQGGLGGLQVSGSSGHLVAWLTQKLRGGTGDRSFQGAPGYSKHAARPSFPLLDIAAVLHPQAQPIGTPGSTGSESPRCPGSGAHLVLKSTSRLYGYEFLHRHQKSPKGHESHPTTDLRGHHPHHCN